jgi:hypothetical protein
MRNGPFRHATILLLILALLVGPSAGVMSMAATTPAMDMTGPDGDDGCRGCLPSRMTVADCGMMCISLPAIIALGAAFPASGQPPPWRRHDEQVEGYPTKPPTAPPRSDG